MREFNAPASFVVGEQDNVVSAVYENAATHPDYPIYQRLIDGVWTNVSCAQAADCVSFECGADGRCRNDNGCADGTREGFGATASYPDIAACAGGWSLPGLVDTRAPACGRAAGNASQNPSGKDCNVADLCQVGWHVCEDASEVKTRSGGNGCAGAAFAAGAQVFFVVRQSGPGGAMCGEGENDIFGCGTVGAAPDATTCGVLDRFSHDLCSQLPATWACGSGDTSEASAVRKTAAANGGVLCCRN